MVSRFIPLLAASLAASAAVASPLNYAYRATPIRSAVVLIASQQRNGQFDNPAPFVFYNLDANKNIKPGGWSFYNPTAPTRVTSEIKSRWDALSGGSMTVGDPITKKTAAYWELDLASAGEAQMANYDMLMVSCTGTISLNASEREKLRRFMERGGVLWVDISQTSLIAGFDYLNGFPLPFNISNAATGAASSYNAQHPLFSRPYAITGQDVFTMASENLLGLRDIDLTALGHGDLVRQQSSTEFDSRQFNPVAEDSQGTKVAVAQVGEGYMVVTSRNVSATLNRVYDPLTGSPINNPGPYGRQPMFSRSADAAAKLAINIVHLTSSYAQIGKGSRKTNSSILDLGAPMLKRWNADVALTPGSFNFIPPAIFKGRLFVLDDNRLYCFDAKPSTDLDNDSDTDDGIRDYSIGSNVDLVWVSQVIPGPTSPPTCAEVPGAATADQVALIDGQGRLLVFNADTGALAATISAPSNPEIEPALPGRGPYAPTYHDGLYVVADQVTNGLNSVGRVWIADATALTALTSTGPFQCGGVSSPIMTRPSASPTVGHIPISDGTGGLDRVIYVPTRPGVGGGPNAAAAVHSLWLGAKGEKPFSWAVSNGYLYVVTQAGLKGLLTYIPPGPSPAGVKLTVIDDNGNPLDANAMDALFTNFVDNQPGLLRFGMETGQTIPSNYSLRIDYTVDWGNNTPGLGAQILRGQLYLPDGTNKRRRILGSVALAPDGYIHLVHSDPDISVGINNNAGGCYYAFQETRPGEFRMASRFELFREHTFTLNQAGTTTYRETLIDQDPITSLIPFLGGRLLGTRFIGPPTVHNGIVYVPAAGQKGFIPMTMLMAFRATPPVPEIAVGDIGGGFTVVQPDLARSDNKAQPTIQSVFTNNNFVYERETGASTGTIRFENLMNIPRGFIGNSINLSQPIILRRNGQPDQLIEPNKTGDRWNPLLWYTVLHGWDSDDGTGPVLVTGNTLFLAGKSALPYFVTVVGMPTLPPPTNGVLMAMNAEIAPNDPFLASDTLRPWQKQLNTLQTVPTFKGNPNFRWPQVEGLTNFNDWKIRLLQTVLGPSTTSFGVVGGEDVLASWSERGVWAFTKSDYIICDEGRLARFDASGNPIWTADAAIKSSQEANAGSSAETKPLVRPTKAYVLNSREMAVVDTGANRIVRLDVSGRESRSIDRLNLDPSYRPDGWSEGDNVRLNNPRDVLVFTTFEANPGQLNNPRPREYWVHYLIADTGNRRIVELVDRYEMDNNNRVLGIVRHTDGTPASAILWWQTPSALSGKSFDYNSLSRVYIEDTANPANSRYVYSAGIGSTMPSRVDFGLDQPTTTTPREAQSGNGGIVVFDGNSTQVVNEVTVPAIGPNAFYDFGTGSFNSVGTNVRIKRLGNVNSVTMRNIIDPTLGNRVAIMFTDSEGVWEIVQNVANGPWIVRWCMPTSVYKVMRRVGTFISPSNARGFYPTYARRLDSGEVLITTAYSGRRLDGSEFNGEVVTVDGDTDPSNNNAIPGFSFLKNNLGFSSESVRAELPPTQGARGIMIPVFADRR